MKVERSKGNLKKSWYGKLTSNDREVYSTVCLAQSNDGQTYTLV